MQRNMFDHGALWTSRKRSFQPPFPIQTAGNAFTLIELLVVVAIISLLAGLLIPNLSRSKAAAQSIVCQSNVRQIGLGLQTYLSNNHYYPVNDLNNTKPLSHEDSERFWTGKLLRDAFSISQPARNFSQKGVWRCPSARWDDSMLSGAGTNGLGSYGYNDDKLTGSKLRDGDDMFGLQGHYVPVGKYFTPIGEAEVVAPSNMMAIGDSFEGNWLFVRRSIEVFAQWGNILTRHQGKANVAFCDGHVETPTLAFLFENSSDAALIRWNRNQLPHHNRLSP